MCWRSRWSSRRKRRRNRSICEGVGEVEFKEEEEKVIWWVLEVEVEFKEEEEEE